MLLNSDPLDDNDVLFELRLDFNSASSLTLQSVGRHVTSLHHYHLMGRSEVTCLPTDCNVSELALLKSNPSTKRTSLSSNGPE
jgi:hypothetical protein